MSNSQTNEFTIFFRPANSQPYVIAQCANWLYSLGRATSPTNAYNYLVWLENHNPAMFRHFISEYHRTHTFKTGYLVYENDHNAFRSATGQYGEDSHMYNRRVLNDSSMDLY